MRRILVVCPRFAPMNAPDQQRIRVSLGHFEEFGWTPTVLAITPETGDTIIDPLLLEVLPRDVEISRVAAWNERICRRFGFGHLDYRSLIPLFRAGSKLLRAKKFEVIYFSTTAFTLFLLAPIWKRLFGCKIVFDFQDPWYREASVEYSSKTAPGGLIRYRLSQLIARFGERFAISSADHIVSTSSAYKASLMQRYPTLSSDHFSVIPFGAAPTDYELVERKDIKQQIFDPGDGLVHWVYVGRGGPDMNPVLTAFFRNLAAFQSKQPDLVSRLKIHFVGTNYSPRDRTFKVVEPIAARHGITELVEEHSERIPYFEALRVMSDSNAVLLIGSIGGDYTASKLLNCVLSKRPVLAIFHNESLVSKSAAQFPSVRLVTFSTDLETSEFDSELRKALGWLASANYSSSATNDEQLIPFLAEALTKKQCEVFDRVIAR